MTTITISNGVVTVQSQSTRSNEMAMPFPKDVFSFHHDDPVHDSFNNEGQPLDSFGRTCGPKPKPSYESELGWFFRVLPVFLPDGSVYDRWANLIPPGSSK